MTVPVSPEPNSFASKEERDSWHTAQDIAFRAGASLILRDGSTWLVSDGQERLVCKPRVQESVWWETAMALEREFPALWRLWAKNRARTKPDEMNQWDSKFAHESERVLHQHPSVKDCAVLGYSEEGIAYVVLADGAKFDPIALIAHCQKRLDTFKPPHRVRLVDRIPRDPAGKIDYDELRSK